MELKEKDFIEIEFTGKTEDGEVFDSNRKEDLNSTNMKSQAEPFVFCIGEGMFLKGVEDYLIGKDVGQYEIQLTPEKAFGKRNPSFVRIIPMKVFRENNLNPVPGVMFNFDGRLAKVLSVSGGRVIADFNNPIAGKNVVYDVKVLRKVDDINEKAKSLINFFFRRDLKFEIKDKKLILELEKEFKQFADLLKEKFKEALDLELEIKEETKTNNNQLFDVLYEKIKPNMNGNPKNYGNPLIIAFGGVPGSGKTTIAKNLEEKYNGIRIGRDEIFNAVEELKLNKEEFENKNYQDFIYFLIEKSILYNTLIMLDKSIERNYERLFDFCNKNKINKFVVNLDIGKEKALQRIFERENVDKDLYKKLIEKWIEDYEKFKQQVQPDISLNGENPDMDKLFNELDKRLK